MLDRNKVKVGIAPIGWTNDDLPELGGDISFNQCISEMHIAGYEGCEIGSKFPKNSELLMQSLLPFNLQIAGQWFSSFLTSANDSTLTINAFKNHLAFLKEVGARVSIVSEQGYSIQGNPNAAIFDEKPIISDEGWEKLFLGLEKMGKLARKSNIKLAYHHHMGTVIQTQAEIDRLMESTNPKLVSLVADTGHIVYSGGDPDQLLNSYIDRVVHVHLKDIRQHIINECKIKHLSFLEGVKKGTFTVPGDGDINFQTIFNTLGESDYTGWIIVEAEQDPSIANPLKYAQIGRDTIRKLGGI